MKKNLVWMVVAFLFAVVPSIYAKDTQFAANVYFGESYNYLYPGDMLFVGGIADNLVSNDLRHYNFTPGFGVSCSVPVSAAQSNWLNSYRLGLDMYFLNRNQSGKVYVFSDPRFDNYFYNLKVNTERLMLSGQIVAAPWWNRVFPFLELAMGGAKIDVSYREKPNVAAGIVDGQINLQTHGQHNFVYSAGAGFSIPITPHLGSAVGYQFTDFGHVKSDNYAADQAVYIQTIDARFTSHVLYLRLSYLF